MKITLLRRNARYAASQMSATNLMTRGSMFDLTGRSALVTGARRGVGLGIAPVLIDAGAIVIVNDLLPERAREATAGLGSGAPR